MSEFKHIKQGEKDCGPACFAMVTGKTLEEAREILHRRGWDEPSGCSPIQLLNALAGEGYSVRYSFGSLMAASYDDLVKYNGTAILTVKSKTRPDGLHFIVLHNGQFYDPQEGNGVEIYKRNARKYETYNNVVDVMEIEPPEGKNG